VVAERKKAILQGARQTMVQELALCESETERLQEHIKDLENALAQNKDLTAPELDGALLARRNDLPQTESWRNTFAALEGAMIARRGELQDRIEREEHQLGVLRVRLQKEKSDYEKHAALAHAVSQMEVANFRFQYETTRLEVENAEARIKRYTDEFRRLPIRRAETMQAAAHGRADFLKKELRTLDVAMQTVHESGRPPAHRVLTGMDAREFKVESAWVDDRPAVTNRRTLTALTFLALMGLTFGLLFAYDRNHPAAGAAMGEPAAGASGPLRARVVHVAGSGNSGVTVTHVDLDRLSVRIHHWIRPEEETNGHPALTIGPNGRVEEPRQLPAPAPAADEADPLARRIHNWLGNGTDDGTRG
jgi:hypothetical protein